MEIVWKFPKRVEQGADGAYRWTYDLRENNNDEPFWVMLRICLAVNGPIAAIMTVMTWQFIELQALLYALLFLALTVGLPALIWKLSRLDPSFKMTGEAIEAWPKGKGVNVHTFARARRVIVERDFDRIRLCWVVGSLHVYVPKADFDTVLAFILAHVPETAVIE